MTEQSVKFCQSRIIPIENPDFTKFNNAGGSKNSEYGLHCYKNGKFTANILWKRD